MLKLLPRLRLPVLCALAAAAVLGAGVRLAIPGTALQHGPAALGLFDVAVWPALALALLIRLCEDGPRGVLKSLGSAPLAGYLLLALALWSGLVWPRLAGAEPPALTAAARDLVQLAEYGLAAFIACAELGAEERARRWAAAVLAGALGLIVLVGAVQYFRAGPDFGVGSLLGNRNALGAFLAVAAPFCAAMALGLPGGCCAWRPVWTVLAAALALLALTGGAVLGLVCGALAAAACLGRRKLLAAAGALLVLLAVGQALPRHNLSAAVESVRLERKNPRVGEAPAPGAPAEPETLLAMRYVRLGYELNMLRASLTDRKLLFGLGPGGYGREKRFRPKLAERPAGQTDNPENYDVLADEPNTFDFFLGAGVRMGVLGVLGFLWLFAWWAGRALAAWRTGRGELDRAVAAGAFGAVLGAAAAGLFSSPWIQGAGPLLVMLVALARPVRESPADQTEMENGAGLTSPPGPAIMNMPH